MSEENKEVELTDAQKTYVLANYDKLSLIEMTQELSGNPKADGRHKMGRVIRSYLALQGLETKTTKFEAVGPLELTDEQKELIRNNADSMKSMEMTKIIFNNEKLTPLSKEFRAVYKYLEEIAPNIVKKDEAPVDEEDYKAPTSIYRLITLVNKYVPNSKKENEPLYNPNDMKKLTPQDERNLRALLGYMNVYRFSQQISRYTKKMDRNLFESSFIGFTWDKPDLLREEVEQYISLCAQIVTSAQLEGEIQGYRDIVETQLDSKDQNIRANIVDALDNARDKLKETQTSIEKSIKALTGSRSERMKGKIAANATILNLVEAFQSEKKRLELLALAERQKQAEKDEIDKIANMEDVIALIGGLTKDEITN